MTFNPQSRDEPDWRRLYEATEDPAQAGGDERNSRLWHLLSPLIEARRHDHGFVIAQLGQSLDGRIATPAGHSHYINGPDALVHLHRLRALVDAVVVGASTIASDDPQLTVRHTAGDNPVRVVIDPNRRLATDHKAFDPAPGGIVVIGSARTGDPAHLRCLAPPGSGDIAPEWIVAALADLGLKRLLVEGGASTVSRFIAAYALDRLHILVGPIIIGDGPTGVHIPGIETLDAAIRPTTACHILDGGDVIFDCDLRTPPK